MPMFRPASPFVLAALATGAAALLAPATAAAQRMTMADVVKVAPENGMPAVGKWKPTWCDAVSYTHLDVYKRQRPGCPPT